MGFWGRGDDVVDWTGGYRSHSTRKKEVIEKTSSENTSDAENDAMRFLGGLANSAESNDNEEKENKEHKAMGNMTERIEELSNQIYRIEQRLETIEKKLKI